MRPFRFGVMSTGSACDEGGWTGFARRVEDLGYATLHVPQHFSMRSVPPLPALALAAGGTSTLTVGTLVLDNEATHPAVVARDAAWLATEIRGRFELGIGAGWLAADHTALGSTWRPAGARIDRLDEALTLIRRMWAGATSFHGRHYDVDGLPGDAATAGPPRVLVGGGGPRVLALAARHADVVGIAPDMRSGRIGRESARTTGGAEVRDKTARIRAAAPDVELHMAMTAVIDAGDDVRLARTATAFGVPVDRVPTLPSVLVGDTPAIVDALRARREETGISYVSVHESVLERMAPVVAQLAGA